MGVSADGFVFLSMAPAVYVEFAPINIATVL